VTVRWCSEAAMCLFDRERWAGAEPLGEQRRRPMAGSRGGGAHNARKKAEAGSRGPPIA
jgi:hypothetical protein